MSRAYAEVIGDPIAHSKSPLIHNFWLGKLGIDAEYRRCHVLADELQDYFTQRRKDANWRGCNVTIPHKLSVLQFADDRDSTVDDVGAANCIVPRDGKLVAFNTDTAGVDAAVNIGHNTVCLIGAGGAALSVFWPLDVMSVHEYRVIARDPKKAATAFLHLPYEFAYFTFDEAEAAMRGVDGVINASPLGMTGQPPMPQAMLNALSVVAPDAYVFDMVYVPLETKLLKEARARGLEAIDGLTMLIGQAAEAFKQFYGVHPDPERQYEAELRALLTS